MFRKHLKARFVEFGFCPIHGIVDFQVYPRFTRDFDEVCGNAAGGERLEDEVAVASCHKPERANFCAELLHCLGDVNSFAASIGLPHFSPVGFANLKARRSDALVYGWIQRDCYNHDAYCLRLPRAIVPEP